MSTDDPAPPPSAARLCERSGLPRWQPRRKRALRRLRNDLRNALPMLGLALCFGLSAGAIFATGWLPAERETSLPAVSAALLEDLEQLDVEDERCATRDPARTPVAVGDLGGAHEP